MRKQPAGFVAATRRMVRTLSASWLLAVIGCVATSVIHADELAELCDAYELARLTGDVETAQKLVGSEANWINSKGKPVGKILAEIRKTSEKLEENKDAKPSNSRTLERAIAKLGDTAIVTELISSGDATGHATLRRTLVWMRQDAEWKLVHAHDAPYAVWEKSISDYEVGDKTLAPSPGGVVFIGSSSIRGWKSLQEDFPGAHVIRRGFGGSQMVDSLLYADRIVIPYRPSAVAVYAGDNDINGGKSAEQVFQDFKLFVDKIHGELPKARVGFIAIKPSLARKKLWPIMKTANEMIEAYAHKQPLVDYLDIATPMLNADGTPQEHLFVEDGLHLNADGYALWTSVIRPWVNGPR